MAKISATLMVFLSVLGLNRCGEPAPISNERKQALYAEPLAPPEAPVAVFHIGHSLVGREMPAMLAQMAGPGHRYETQTGWGAYLRQHWEPDVPLNGAEVENDHPRYREAHEAMASGDYDVLVLTEAVEIRDAIDYNQSWDYLARWARAARAGNPEIRVYLYETWHETNDPEGWLYRIDRDLGLYWEREILDRALAVDGVGPIYVIPAGQVLARFLREVDAQGGVGGITGVEDLIGDTIHINHIGSYLVALTHYAVIYGRSPVGLPHELRLASGETAIAPTEEAALLMQKIVWEVVTGYPRTGVRAAR